MPCCDAESRSRRRTRPARRGRQPPCSHGWPPATSSSSPTETARRVGLLALMSDAYTETTPYPLDVLGSETEGQIGYVLELELDNAIRGQETVVVLTRVVVDASDPAFSAPSKFIGPVY